MADLRDVCNLLEQIRDALIARGALIQPPSTEKANADGSTGTPRGLRIDPTARLAYWSGRRLSINSHADFSVLARLAEGAGALVSYQELERAVFPSAFGDRIAKQFDTVAPQDVKDAVQHIRHAFRQAACPVRIENVRQKGYRLIDPTNNLLPSTFAAPISSGDEVHGVA